MTRLPLELLERLRAGRKDEPTMVSAAGVAALALLLYAITDALRFAYGVLADAVTWLRWARVMLFTAVFCLVIPVTSQALGPYFNSAEPGCDGSDPNVLFCDDFEKDWQGNAPGTWYVTDGDTGGPFGSGFGPDYPPNKGWAGTIYANPITPANAIICGAGITPFGNCAANGGFHPSAALEGNINMAFHYFKRGRPIISEPSTYGAFNPNCGTTGRQRCAVDEIFIRWYSYWSPGYAWGQEKHLNVTNSDGDIAFVDIQVNCSHGDSSTTGTIYHQVYHCTANCTAWTTPNCAPNNTGPPISFTGGRWYFQELHVIVDAKTGVPGSGRIRHWVNDCGPSGTACGSAPILRFDATGGLPGNIHGTLIDNIWPENWNGSVRRPGQPESVICPTDGATVCMGASGTGPYWDQFKVSTAGPIGFAGGGPGGVAPQPPTFLRFALAVLTAMAALATLPKMMA